MIAFVIQGQRSSGETFRIWFQTVPPRPSWTAYKQRSAGTLTMADNHARFVPKGGEPVLISNVFRVSMGSRESVYLQWLPASVDNWIEVLYGDRTKPSVAYINHTLLAFYLPRTKLLRALRSLVAT